MTHLRDTYPDLLDPGSSTTQYRVVATLDRLYNREALPPAVDATVLAAIHSPNALVRRSKRTRFLRPLAVLLPVPLLILGIQSSLRDMNPAPASAEVILQRAAMVKLPANRCLHVVYRRWLGNNTGRDEVWEQVGRKGTIIRAAGTTIERVAGTIVSIERYVDGNHITRGFYFEPASGYLKTYTSRDLSQKRWSGPFGAGIFGSGPDVARYVRALTHTSHTGVRLLPERHFHGVLVYPIRVDGNVARSLLGFTAYIDARSYILRGIDGSDPSGVDGHVAMDNQILVMYQVVPLSALSPGTFQLRPPHGN